MRRFVLGILAVVLLQIGFYLYMGTDKAPIARWRPAPTVTNVHPEQKRLSSLPEAARPSPESLETAANGIKTRIAPRTSVSRGSVKRYRINTEPDRVWEDGIRHARLASAAKPSNEWNPRLVAAKVVIPRGHTMVLVDYLPVNSGNGKRVVTSRERLDAAGNSPRPDIKRSLVAPSLPESVEKPRKRSYLARTLPALVNKPWKWMRSLASKLN